MATPCAARLASHIQAGAHSRCGGMMRSKMRRSQSLLWGAHLRFFRQLTVSLKLDALQAQCEAALEVR